MIAALLAVGASIAYGASDVTAGVASRRVPAIAIAWWSHVVGAAGTGALALAAAGRPPAAGLALGSAAGAIAGAGLLVYYGALARGQVSVVAPLAASGIAVPVVVGAVTGAAPGPLGWAGLALAATGVVVVARSRSAADEPNPPCPGGRPGCPEEEGARAPRLPPVLGALLAAAAFGVTFVLIDLAGRAGGGAAAASPLWTAAGLQAGGLLVLVPVLLAGPVRRVAVPRAALPPLALTAVLVSAGDVALALALGTGDLATVSVLGSLDSVVSVLLARLVLTERLGRVQGVGVAAAVGGAVLLAAA
ncbi:EamA family transporter [Geodermatophilus sp. YIM 151500]|uniref:EamA family transporter n=1 Tax=Geodermatophilus sp. YIM 151500 TaxID=2984531 RepID=UPI0021E4F22E|nr:EamA family transporter [Geodermatophilus sp. YIM 151500]MCV2487845.1 EamA family transporter [Geodermatophilus sp. YIM 151500]